VLKILTLKIKMFLEKKFVIGFYRLGLSSLFLLLAFLFNGVENYVYAAAPGNPCGGIGGTVRAQDTTISQQGGGTLNARIFAPDASLQTAPCPEFRCCRAAARKFRASNGQGNVSRQTVMS
jgi:hypothetical protein